MTLPSDPRARLLEALAELARELPPAMLSAVVSRLDSQSEGRKLERLAATPALREKLRSLDALREQLPEIDSKAIALALRAAEEAVRQVANRSRFEIAWTGPETEAVPVRRVDQVLYAMIERARSEVLLVTYVAYKAERALAALSAAAASGARVKLVIELAHESGGKVSFDGLGAFKSRIPSAEIYYWPLVRRPTTSSGSYGAMHAKCLVVDGREAIVSSANLTDYALEANMELGIVVGSSVAGLIRNHFDQLIARGELLRVP